MNELWLSGLWGFLAGGALLLGAIIGYYVNLPRRIIAGVMAFGSGVLISALTVELMLEAVQTGGFLSAAIGFVGGAAIYTGANKILTKQGVKGRKRSGSQHPDDEELGTEIAVGALVDGIPESIAIGLTMLEGGAVSMATVIAIFLSNIPEGLSSSTGMKRAGRSKKYIFGLWLAIAVATGIAALAGYGIFDAFSSSVVAATTAVIHSSTERLNPVFMGDRENKKTDEQYQDIHLVEEKYSFVQKEWQTQKVLKIMGGLLLTAGLLGLFGGGWLSQRVITGSDFTVKYHQFIREESPTKLYVYLDEPTDTTVISFNSSYLEEVQIQQTMPTPVSAKTSDGRIYYSFSTSSSGLIVFYLLADNAGPMELILRVDGETKRLEQFIFF